MFITVIIKLFGINLLIIIIIITLKRILVFTLFGRRIVSVINNENYCSIEYHSKRAGIVFNSILKNIYT